MRKLPAFACALIAAASILASAHAADLPTLKFGAPTFHGSGCDNQSASGTPSPEGTGLTLIFDRMETIIGGLTRRRAQTLQCVVKIPVEVTPGWSVALTQDDLRIRQSMEESSQSVVTLKGRFAH